MLQRQQASFLPGSYHLVPKPRGSLNSLVPEAVAVGELAPGQMAVRVCATGINFRDLLNVSVDVRPACCLRTNMHEVPCMGTSTPALCCCLTAFCSLVQAYAQAIHTTISMAFKTSSTCQSCQLFDRCWGCTLATLVHQEVTVQVWWWLLVPLPQVKYQVMCWCQGSQCLGWQWGLWAP